MGRANTCQDPGRKRWPRDANATRRALSILKGIALSHERKIYYREIRVTERRVSSAKVAVVKGTVCGRASATWYPGERYFAISSVPLSHPPEKSFWYSTILRYCYSDAWINMYKKYPTFSLGKGVLFSIERFINKRKCREIRTLYIADCNLLRIFRLKLDQPDGFFRICNTWWIEENKYKIIGDKRELLDLCPSTFTKFSILNSLLCILMRVIHFFLYFLR